MKILRSRCGNLFALLLAAFCLGPARSAGAADGKNTVVWVSMDGFRHDYLDRAELPFFARLMKEGAYSRKFHPVFPPITFPSHCAEATGAPVASHGIPGNHFRDAVTGAAYHFPADASLLRAEPIWLTAARQGIRALVFDWPLSQKQPDPGLHTDYFDRDFDFKQTDAQRLDRVLATWQQDNATRASGPAGPLRLVMGYVEGTDPVGHQAGPDAPPIAAELRTLGGQLDGFAQRALALWKEHAASADRFYLLLTTDHGMSPVNHDANLERMLDLPHGGAPGVAVETTGNMGQIYLDRTLDAPAREARTAAFMEKLKSYPFARAYRREDLPPAWAYNNPTRTGDIVVVLPRGYTFNRMAAAVAEAAQVDGPKGMHGYPVEDDPEMYGVMFLWRYPQPFGGKDLGEVNWDQYHPTVAKLLGIKPADGAKGKPLALPGE